MKARKFKTAERWATILTDEFSNQGVMEEELEIPSCLFGGPPVRDNIIKMGESQIGFMNIFARPLFEAVADILPAMQFSVEEILSNMSIWEKKIEEEKDNKKKKPSLSLGLLTPGFAPDPSPSPLSGGPMKPFSEAKPQPLSHANFDAPLPLTPTKKSLSDESNRRSSSGSHTQLATVSASPRSSLGLDKGSRRSSGAGIPVGRSLNPVENQSQSRRGSGDASLTAILVTQTPNTSDKKAKDMTCGPRLRSASPAKRKDTKTKSPNKTSSKAANDGDKDGARPVTAPSPSRCSQGKNTNLKNYPPYTSSRPLGTGPDFDSATHLFPISHPPSQSHSEIDLSHASNGNLDGSRMHHWDTSKGSGDGSISRPDGERESGRRGDWWKQMSHRRRTRDLRNCGGDAYGQHKEIYLAPITSNSNSTSSTSPIQERSITGKFSRLFKRKQKPMTSKEVLNSPQLRQGPTSNPDIPLRSGD